MIRNVFAGLGKTYSQFALKIFLASTPSQKSVDTQPTLNFHKFYNCFLSFLNLSHVSSG